MFGSTLTTESQIGIECRVFEIVQPAVGFNQLLVILRLTFLTSLCIAASTILLYLVVLLIADPMIGLFSSIYHIINFVIARYLSLASLLNL